MVTGGLLVLRRDADTECESPLLPSSVDDGEIEMGCELKTEKPLPPLPPALAEPCISVGAAVGAVSEEAREPRETISRLANDNKRLAAEVAALRREVAELEARWVSFSFSLVVSADTKQ
ncbi:hypothetical protein MFIFM68171_03140 [Madurella fahalii]|uniref:Uncharacterized protein n=1 Tax=Madurella fahalii TaxID=1157608 RepID=A0ABQ0G5S8_9PEZI